MMVFGRTTARRQAASRVFIQTCISVMYAECGGPWYKRLENGVESCSIHLTALNIVMEGTIVKVSIALTILTSAHRSRAGVIPLENDALQEQHASSLASSFIHFHGPVEGPEYEVKVPYVMPASESNHLHGQDHEDHGYTVDYVAHPKYEYSYGVEDHHTGDFHSQKESRDGSSVSGQYSVKEPGGGIRVVSYRADKDGFHAVVHTSGKNNHSNGVYSGQDQTQVHGHEGETQQEQDVHDYITSYANE